MTPPATEGAACEACRYLGYDSTLEESLGLVESHFIDLHKREAALRARVAELEKEMAETQAASGTRIDALTARIDYLNELAPSQALKEAAESKAREERLRKAVGAYIEWYETDPSLIHNTNARVLVEIITPKLKAAIAERPAPPKESP